MSTRVRFAFRSGEILVSAGIQNDAATLELDSSAVELPEPIDTLVLSAGIQALSFDDGTDAPHGWEWMPFRGVIGALPENEWLGAARAMALLNWRRSTRYCGVCGHLNDDKPDELARLCPSCGAVSYPRLSPAVLAVVRRGNRLLLARNATRKTGAWSILAGFVEPGETLEGCVAREVREEVGIEVAAHSYLGSQPWPFPDQLMLGMAAEWRAGELAPDGVEIAEAGWFGPDDHPPLPMHGSLSRRLIDAAFDDISRGGTPR